MTRRKGAELCTTLLQSIAGAHCQAASRLAQLCEAFVVNA
jgi:hypothetical protein